jgi:hypothetical protein
MTVLMANIIDQLVGTLCFGFFLLLMLIGAVIAAIIGMLKKNDQAKEVAKGAAVNLAKEAGSRAIKWMLKR